MSVQLQSTNSVKADAIKVVVYGPAKIGKTRLAITAPSPVIVSTEKGLLSLRKENLPFIDVSNLNELANAYIWLKSPQAARFKTFIFDSISDLGEIILGEEKSKNKNGQKAYGNLNEKIMQIFRDFRELQNRHVVFIAKEMQYQGSNNMQCVRPTMPDQYLTGQLPYMFDLIAHMTHVRFNDGNVHVGFNCKASEQVTAGDRSGTLDEWEPPNLAHIFSKIERG